MTTSMTDRQIIATLSEALLRLMFGGTINGSALEGDGWEAANEALLAAGAYSFGRPHPTKPNLVLHEIGAGAGARTVELWSWNRWPNGWAGCRAKDEPACYFPADKWEAVNDAPDFPAGPGPIASTRLASLLTCVEHGVHCGTHGCKRAATHVLLGPDGEPVPGSLGCEPCVRLCTREYREKLGERWHAVAPVSERDPRDRLLGELTEWLDINVNEAAVHQDAMSVVRSGLRDTLGDPQTDTLRLLNDTETEQLDDWYRLPRGWVGRRTKTGRYEYFSAVNWVPEEAA